MSKNSVVAHGIFVSVIYFTAQLTEKYRRAMCCPEEDHLANADSGELVEIQYLKAEIILELNTVHDREHRGGGGAAYKQHLKETKC